MIPCSVLDLSPVVEGGSPAESLRNTLDLARHAERWGYHRFWLAEHHNMTGIASAATSVVIGYVAQGTSTIRVGAGGVMLPNHAPLMVAEQFGTLETLYPGRIDLGLGRAPGTDQVTMHALRRNLAADVDQFPHDVLELMAYFAPVQPGQRVQAVPGADLDLPIFILGSSLFGAGLAAALGLPFAFASHFAPQQMMEALALYRSRFQSPDRLDKPYVMLGVNVCAADTDEEARRLFTSWQQAFVNLRSGRPGPLPPPRDGYAESLPPMAAEMLDQILASAVVGSAETVQAGLEAFIAKTGADELIVTGQIYDHPARLRSFEIVAETRERIAEGERESLTIG